MTEFKKGDLVKARDAEDYSQPWRSRFENGCRGRVIKSLQKFPAALVKWENASGEAWYLWHWPDELEPA